MAKRSSGRQSRHDNCVRAYAVGLERRDYYVKADIHGFEEPPKINGFIPDIYATRGSAILVIEVETKETEFADEEQHGNFRIFEASNENVKFEVIIAGPQYDRLNS